MKGGVYFSEEQAMYTSIIGDSVGQLESFSQEACPAKRLGPGERKDLAVQVLARARPVTHLAREEGVSRKFLYRQASRAELALDGEFDPAEDDHDILFELPVTKRWLEQLVLGLVLVCHSSYRGVIELLRGLFDVEMSIGKIHNIVRSAVERARGINEAQDLSRIRVGAHDEIFQAGNPVLVGADVDSTYCYLLSPEEHRDGDTWGVHLLDLADRGLRPDYTIADAGKGLRAGQKIAWPGTPCHGDVFHPLLESGRLAYYLENRASGAVSAREKLEGKMERARKHGRGQAFSKKLALARKAEKEATALAEDVRTLADWMKNDVLSLAGPDLPTRRELFDFIVDELRAREGFARHRIRPVRRALENQRDELLSFAAVLDEELREIARRLEVPPYLVQAVCELQGLDEASPARWQREAELREKLRWRHDDVQRAVVEAMSNVPRASSIIENLNGRLRNYFFLRRQLGPEYLDLLRFFLNHRTFMRSDRPERVGKSPAELLTGKKHAHWLELLGYELFRRN